MTNRSRGGSDGFVPSAPDWDGLLGRYRTKPRRCRWCDPAVQGEVMQVFVHWRTAMGFLDERFTPGRRQAILAALRAGYTTNGLCLIVNWAATDPWMRGKNRGGRPYDDVDDLFRLDRIHRYLLRALYSIHAPSEGRLSPEF